MKGAPGPSNSGLGVPDRPLFNSFFCKSGRTRWVGFHWISPPCFFDGDFLCGMKKCNEFWGWICLQQTLKTKHAYSFEKDRIGISYAIECSYESTNLRSNQRAMDRGVFTQIRERGISNQACDQP